MGLSFEEGSSVHFVQLSSSSIPQGIAKRKWNKMLMSAEVIKGEEMNCAVSFDPSPIGCPVGEPPQGTQCYDDTTSLSDHL